MPSLYGAFERVLIRQKSKFLDENVNSRIEFCQKKTERELDTSRISQTSG